MMNILYINPNGLVYLKALDCSISNRKGMFISLLLHVPCFIEIPVFNANSVDPDQMPHSMASDLGLHCLPMSLLWEARHKCVFFLFGFYGPFKNISLILS